MSKFITGHDLEKAITDIIWEAKEILLIVSPFIKLDDYFKKHFERNKSNSRLHLLVVFGKNTEDKSKSLSADDFEFFKAFPNVSIIYVHNLHAKYYGNESKGVITSVNMYDYSFKNNIEFGVLSEASIMNKLTHSADQDAWEKCMDIADNGEPVFIKRPVFKKKIISVLGKDYVSSEVLFDNTEAYFSLYGGSQRSKKKLVDFPGEIDFSEQRSQKPTREQFTPPKGKNNFPISIIEEPTNNYTVHRNGSGFCIRTGQPIPFNIKRPLSDSAYRTWSQFGNENYPEAFCHFLGEPSNGETSFARPIMQRNWKRAQSVHKL